MLRPPHIVVCVLLGNVLTKIVNTLLTEQISQATLSSVIFKKIQKLKLRSSVAFARPISAACAKQTEQYWEHNDLTCNLYKFDGLRNKIQFFASRGRRQEHSTAWPLGTVAVCPRLLACIFLLEFKNYHTLVGNSI